MIISRTRFRLLILFIVLSNSCVYSVKQYPFDMQQEGFDIKQSSDWHFSIMWPKRLENDFLKYEVESCMVAGSDFIAYPVQAGNKTGSITGYMFIGEIDAIVLKFKEEDYRIENKKGHLYVVRVTDAPGMYR